MKSDQTYILPIPTQQGYAERETEGPPGPKVVTGPQSGPVSPEDIAAAVGHYAEYAPMDMSNVPYSTIEDADLQKKNGAFRVHEGYGGTAKETDMRAPIDLSSAEDRLKFLNGFTQGGADDPNSKNMCGPTSLIGGAVLANGANGVGTLLDAVDKLAPSGKEDKLMKDLRAKLDPANPQPLTGADLANAQSYIYARLNASEGLDVNDPKAMENATDAEKGLNPRTMQKLFQGSPELSALYKENHMEIASIDTGGSNGLMEDHAVLRMTDADGQPLMIYDPGQRTNGQVTGRIDGWSGKESATIDNGLADYEYARRGGIRPD